MLFAMCEGVDTGCPFQFGIVSDITVSRKDIFIFSKTKMHRMIFIGTLVTFTARLSYQSFLSHADNKA